MANPAVIAWLRRTASSEAAHSLLFAAGCLVLAGFLVILTFAGAFVLIWVVLTNAVGVFPGPGVDIRVVGIGAVLLVGMLFWGYARANRKAIANSRRQPESIVSEVDQKCEGAETRGSILAYPDASSAGLMTLLGTGPRLASIGWQHARRAIRLRRLDYPACARIVETILARTQRMPLNELFWRTSLENPIEPLAQLRDLGGILILRRRPAGVILHPEWRRSLAGCVGAGDAPEASSAPTLPLEAEGANPAEVLGLPANASFEEVESGYRRRLRVVVPHKVADPELRELAEEQRSAIQAAYENFLEQHKTRPEPTPARSVERLWEEQRASHRDLQDPSQ